jgi:hypothetical protein
MDQDTTVCEDVTALARLATGLSNGMCQAGLQFLRQRASGARCVAAVPAAGHVESRFQSRKTLSSRSLA